MSCGVPLLTVVQISEKYGLVKGAVWLGLAMVALRLLNALPFCHKDVIMSVLFFESEHLSDLHHSPISVFGELKHLAQCM